jgi:hypothetical protein
MRSIQQTSQNLVVNFAAALYAFGALCYTAWYLWINWPASDSVITTGLFGLVRSLIWPIWLFVDSSS